MLRQLITVGSVLVVLGVGAGQDTPCENPVTRVEFEVTTPESKSLALADTGGLLVEVLEGSSTLRLRLVPDLVDSDSKDVGATVTYKAIYTFETPGQHLEGVAPALVGEVLLEAPFGTPLPVALPGEYRIVPLRIVTHCGSVNSVNDNLFGGNCCLSSGGATVCGCEVFNGGRYCCGTACCPPPV